RRPILSPAELFLPVEELNRHLRRHPRARVQQSDRGVQFDFRALPAAAPQRGGNPFAPLQTLVMEHAPLRVLVCAETAGRREALLELMQKQGIQPALVDGWQTFLASQDGWQLTVGELEQGFWAPRQ